MTASPRMRRRPPVTHVEATEILRGFDPVIDALAAHHGPMRLPARARASERFERTARSIAYQQLAGAAADTIWGRTRALVGEAPFEPRAVLELDDAELRGAGLSGAKAAALRDLAWKVDTGEVRLDRLGHMDDDAVVAELTKVRGIGPWSAQMVLLFDLRRLDVWPTGDFGVRNGYHLAYGLSEMPTPKEMLDLGERFSPFRSIAAWYCWRATESLPDA